MLCCHCLEIPNNFQTRGPVFSVFMGPSKLCSWSWLHRWWLQSRHGCLGNQPMPWEFEGHVGFGNEDKRGSGRWSFWGETLGKGAMEHTRQAFRSSTILQAWFLWFTPKYQQWELSQQVFMLIPYMSPKEPWLSHGQHLGMRSLESSLCQWLVISSHTLGAMTHTALVCQVALHKSPKLWCASVFIVQSWVWLSWLIVWNEPM